MAKPNVLVDISGNLLNNEEMYKRLKQITEKYSITLCIGGGEQINEEFRGRGFEIKFGIMGRITKTLEERQVARDVLEANRIFVQGRLDERGISVRVIIPVDGEGEELCHYNGDIKILYEYNRYEKIFRFTRKEKVAEKKEFIRLIEIAFQYLMKTTDKLDKIVIEGF